MEKIAIEELDEGKNRRNMIESEGEVQHLPVPKTKKDYNKKYYESNKIKRLEHQKEKLHCDICNSNYARSHKSRHEKGIQHRRRSDEIKKEE